MSNYQIGSLTKIIIVLIAVISLICFFELCYNVAKIKKILENKEDVTSKFFFLMNIGEKEKARDYLINRIISNKSIFSTSDFADARYKTQLCFKAYAEELKALGIENPFPEEFKEQEKSWFFKLWLLFVRK